jgi:hypothetical protein
MKKNNQAVLMKRVKLRWKVSLFLLFLKNAGGKKIRFF